jgi:tungstate transport system substrate-binding protein
MESASIAKLLRRHCIQALSLTLALLLGGASPAAERSIIVASTTSTQDSGFFDYLLPIVKNRIGISVRVIAQGTGQALDTGRRGDADVILVHAKAAELEFVAQGESVKRYPVMYNDFVLLGPLTDPAGVKGLQDIRQAFVIIQEKRLPFISRGDRSGTHLAELVLWKESGVDLERAKGTWYKSIGQGMGAALNVASASQAYVLSDRATWVHFQNKGNLQILVEGDTRLFNQYGVLLVNPAKHPAVKQALGQAFIDYLISPTGQEDIANYKINGRQVFYPDANDPNA